MKAYSEDLRERIVNSVTSGQDVNNVATRYQVSARTVWRYLKLHREQHNLRPRPRSGRPPKITPEQQQALRQQLREHPTLTLQERCELFLARHNAKLSITTMHRWVKRLRYSRKKPPSGPSRETSTTAGHS